MAEAIEKSPEKTPLRKQHRKRIPMSKIIGPLISGTKNQSEIAKELGVGRAAISKRLKRVKRLFDPDQATIYEDNKATLLSNAEVELLARICQPKALSKANLSALSSAYKVCFDANRLVRGRSTANVLKLDISAIDALLEQVEE